MSVRLRPEPPSFKLYYIFLYTIILSLTLSVSRPAKAVKLKTSYQDGVPLKFNLSDPQNQGLCAELLVLIKEIEPSLQFEYSSTPATLARVELDFKSNQIDIYPCLIYTERRKEFLNYSKYDLFSTQHLVIGRKDIVKQIRTYKDLQEHSFKHPILVLHGSTLIKMLEAKKIRVDNKSASVDGVLKMLISGRAEYYYEQNLNLGRVLEKPEYKGVLVASSAAWDKNTLRFAYSRNLNKKTVTKIENALKVLIESGKIKNLYNKYSNTQ